MYQKGLLMTDTSTPMSVNHSKVEDAFAFLLGTAICALGVQFLGFHQFITGQTAGLGTLLTYLSDWPFGVWFFLLNLPFYLLAKVKMGWAFTIRSFIAVALVSAFSEVFAQLIAFNALPPALSAALGGALIGSGIVVIIRHNASLGGIGVLALYLQDSTGFKAGWTQLIFDIGLFGTALLLFPLDAVLWSLLGAVITNVIIAFNHRKDRYIAR